MKPFSTKDTTVFRVAVYAN